MNAKLYSAILLALVAAPAHAVSLNPKGLGQVLIYPYYTVNKNQDTYLTIVNASSVGKVAKVRFHEGYNGRVVSEFDLYLSAHDVWTATISAPDATATSGARLSWSDRSCIDTLDKNPYPFFSAAYDGSLAGQGIPADSGPQTLARTREGHIEVIALGDIVPGSDLEAAITHIQPNPPTPGGGVPTGASGAAGNCPGAGALTARGDQLVVPTSGLFGSGAIVNVGEGTFYAYNADAISGFTEIPLFDHTNTGLTPSLRSANTPSEATHGVARAHVSTNEGRTLDLDYVRGVDAVSAVLTADALRNEYLVDAGLGANTDWVVTFPTKRFSVDQQLYAGNWVVPFETAFEGGQSRVVAQPWSYDREEGQQQQICTVSPPPPDCPTYTTYLAYEVNVLSLQTDPGLEPGYTSSVLGSRLTPDHLARWGDTGWATLDLYASTHTLPRGTSPSGAAVGLNGLPVTGFMVYNIINNNAQPGKLANYSGLFRHRTTFRCEGVDLACS